MEGEEAMTEKEKALEVPVNEAEGTARKRYKAVEGAAKAAAREQQARLQVLGSELSACLRHAGVFAS